MTNTNRSARIGDACLRQITAIEEASVHIARTQLKANGVVSSRRSNYALVGAILDELVQIFPMTNNAALLVEVAPGLPPVLIPLCGHIDPADAVPLGR